MSVGAGSQRAQYKMGEIVLDLLSRKFVSIKTSVMRWRRWVLNKNKYLPLNTWYDAEFPFYYLLNMWECAVLPRWMNCCIWDWVLELISPQASCNDWYVEHAKFTRKSTPYSKIKIMRATEIHILHRTTKTNKEYFSHKLIKLIEQISQKAKYKLFTRFFFFHLYLRYLET